MTLTRPLPQTVPPVLSLLLGLGACGEAQIGTGMDPTDPESTPVECICDNCTTTEIGVGTATPFDLLADAHEFVGTDAEGALIVDKSNSAYNRFLWVADTNLPGAVKIDLTTFQIVGRYLTGGGSTSRTTVNVLGEAFVGSRSTSATGQPGVTKILPYGQDCPDTNGDGVITTSTGVNDVLPWGQDDCVAWHTEADGDIRGLAAQDIAAVYPEEACTGGDETPVVEPEQHYVWIGGLHGKIYKVDARTGAIVLRINAPYGVYGMALDSNGLLWTGQQMSFIDTKQCIDEATCNGAAVCTASCSTSSCSDMCDGMIKATYPGVSGYGITVDCKDRVWMSNGPTKRYDPSAPANQRLSQGPTSGGGGIAADADGWVWAATNGNNTIRIDSETLDGTSIAAPSKGVAVDSTGRILSVHNTGVHLIEPGPSLGAYEVTNNVTTLAGFAYAYSDMTGVQTRLASDGPGWYRHKFEGCEEGASTIWRNFEWDVDAPEGTWAMFYGRAADSPDGLADAEWRPLMTCATDDGCSAETAFTGLQGRYLEVEMRLIAVDLEDEAQDPKGCSQPVGESVRVRRLSVTHSCSGPVD